MATTAGYRVIGSVQGFSRSQREWTWPLRRTKVEVFRVLNSAQFTGGGRWDYGALNVISFTEMIRYWSFFTHIIFWTECAWGARKWQVLGIFTDGVEVRREAAGTRHVNGRPE